MSAYSKVQLTDTENTTNESLVQNVSQESAVEEQVSKFDNSYEVKLQELYKEYDKITLDEEKIKSVTDVKANAVSHSVSFRMGLALTTTAIVAVLLAFLCIYNIFVINGISNNISYLQEEVTSSRYELVESEGIYNRLTDKNNIQSELKGMGYGDISSIVTVTLPEKAEVVELQAETNWFDSVCNFLSHIFG